MKNFDFRTLDPHAMEAFLAIYDRRSLTEAAESLGVSQSALSHTLGKLRKIFTDPLFLRTGRGVVPSRRSEELAPEMRDIFRALSQLAGEKEFDPASFAGHFTLSVTGYETHSLTPLIFERLRREAPGARLTLKAKREAVDDLAAEDQVDVALARLGKRRRSNHSEQLWIDEYVTYYDPSVRSAPRRLKEFLSAPQAVIVWGDNPRTDLDTALQRRGLRRNVVLQLPDFDSVPVLLRGTDLVVTLPLLLSKRLMHGFAYDRCPVRLPAIPYGIIWHVRNEHDPAQQWLRAVISAEAAKLSAD